MPYFINGNYVGAPMGQAGHQVNIPEHWAMDVIRRRDANLVLAQSCKKMSFVGKKGDTIKHPYLSDLAIYDKVEGSPVNFQSVSENEWQIIIDKYKEVSFSVTDLLALQSQQNLQSEYTERAGYALARDIDNMILAQRAMVVGYTGGVTGTQVLDTGAAITYANIVTAWETLQLNNVPMDAVKLFISVKQMGTLMTKDFFINADYGQGSSVRNGFVGTILGMPVFVSSNLVTNSATGYFNGDKATATADETPGYSTAAPYYPSQTPTLRDGTSLTASPLSAYDADDTAIMAHPDWCVLAYQKMPNIETGRLFERQEDGVIQTHIYGVNGFRPSHAFLINTNE